jgi:DNA polymerase-4
VSFIYGVGKVAAQRFAKDGIRLIADLQRMDERELFRRYGAEGQRLARLARGIDVRAVDPVRERKSVSAENTFERDIASLRPLEKRLWAAAEEVSDRLKEKHLAGSTITLKLKTADFRILTRARSLESPTQPGRIFAAGRARAAGARDQRHALSPASASACVLADADEADPADLIDRSAERRAAAERAADLRARQVSATRRW